jgi:hypothetical protein
MPILNMLRSGSGINRILEGSVEEQEEVVVWRLDSTSGNKTKADRLARDRHPNQPWRQFNTQNCLQFTTLSPFMQRRQIFLDMLM